jgi:hypothetical protein
MSPDPRFADPFGKKIKTNHAENIMSPTPLIGASLILSANKYKKNHAENIMSPPLTSQLR